MQVYLYGANLVSWKQPTPGGEEVLYVRPDAVFDKSKPISGGIPHCFPVFGPAPAPMAQHGFARQSDWTVTNTSADQQPDERDPEVELVLTDNDYTRSMWCAPEQKTPLYLFLRPLPSSAFSCNMFHSDFLSRYPGTLFRYTVPCKDRHCLVEGRY